MGEAAENQEANIVVASDSMLSVIERAAMNPDVDVEKMQRLLDMQEHIFDKNAAIAFNKAMMAVQSELKTIAKDRANDQTRSKYTSFEKLHREIVPIYTKHGFALSFGTDDSPLEHHVRIVCDVTHIDGHSKPYKYDLPLDDTGMKGSKNKTGVHASGSTVSYGRRYLTLLIFNVATGDDDDGNGASEYMSPEQAKVIEDLIKEKKADKKAFLYHFGIESIDLLPKKSFNKAANMLKAKK